jgi:hypothetical protein
MGALLVASFLTLLLAGPALAVGGAPPSAPQGSRAGGPAAESVAAAQWAAPLSRGVAAASGAPTYDWGLAYIYYGPGDDTTHFLGEGASMVVDNALRNITVFGGEGRGGLTNYTVNYNYSTGIFNVGVLFPSPTPRTNASFATVPGRNFAVLFGGLTDLGSQQTANDTWVYYFANQTWVNVTTGPAPPPRESAAFAVNSSGDSALLEGGWDPTYRSNGSTGITIWNDSWQLNLTSWRWSRVASDLAPPPEYGGAMIWQPSTERYLLFGGCALTCTNSFWSFGGDPAQWHPLPSIDLPGPRAAPAFAWDDLDQVALLFGGFTWNGTTPSPLGDTFMFTPATARWTPLDLGGGPGPRYDAPSAWADFPGCIGLNIEGGSPTLEGPPENASVLEPILAPQPNCFPDLLSGGGPPPPPCSIQQVPLSVFVFDQISGLPLPNASVNIDGGCVHRTVYTDRSGYANVSLPAPDRLNITASADGYRSAERTETFLPNVSANLRLGLLPYPSLHVRAYGTDPSGTHPLGEVEVVQGTTLVLGTTDANGWLNTTHIIVPGAWLTVFGSHANYSTASDRVAVPTDGPFYANLTLRSAGNLDLEFVDVTTGDPIPGATGQIHDTDPGGGWPVNVYANSGGWANLSRYGAGNYTFNGSAPGYLPNSTTFYHGWIVPGYALLFLAPVQGATFHVWVEDGTSHLPIANAAVDVGSRQFGSTDTQGWFNFSDIRPTGLVSVLVSASGYVSNQSWVRLANSQVVDRYPVNLSELTACGGPGCVKPVAVSGPPPFSYLIDQGPTGSLLLALPALLVIAGVLYALRLRREGEPPVDPQEFPAGMEER